MFSLGFSYMYTTLHFSNPSNRSQIQEKVWDVPYLIIQIVEVAGYKNMNISHDLQNIQTLKQYYLLRIIMIKNSQKLLTCLTTKVHKYYFCSYLKAF